MSVFSALYSGLFSQLSGGTALIAALGGTAIYQMQAPPNAALPYVVMSSAGGGPENITPSDMRNQIIYVRAYANTPAQANSLDALVSERLHRQVITVTGFTNLYTWRETDFQLVDNPADQSPVYVAGADYRVRLDN